MFKIHFHKKASYKQKCAIIKQKKFTFVTKKQIFKIHFYTTNYSYKEKWQQSRPHSAIDPLTWIEVKIADTSYVGLHLFCKMSKQIPPSAYTLGWNMWLTNLTVGGLFGYSSVNSIVSLNVPSSKGVSCGPKITAFQIMMLLSVGAPLTPVGGSSCSLKQCTSFKSSAFVSVIDDSRALTDQRATNLLKSRIRRRRAGVDIFAKFVGFL